ncbi:hypothetical protein AB0E63_23835 [Kribbella sp. NPDC026596]|uniref:hypothetical protein n=1 Tax=Kribbella sp. NPDC026596 TaxID=3155122 RepID=UPI0033E69635
MTLPVFQRRLCACLAGLVVLFAGIQPASAHPFGDPQTVTIAGDGQVVHVRWKVGGLDDLTLLGVALGVLPRDRVMMDGAVIFEPADSVAIGPSSKFTDYLLRQITVASRGRQCTGSVQPPGDVAKTGVAIDYSCPGPLGAVSVTVKTLTDLNPAYKTLATGPNGARAVYGDSDDSHEWMLGTATASGVGRSAAVQLGAVVGGALLLTVAAAVGVRRVRRRSPA